MRQSQFNKILLSLLIYAYGTKPEIFLCCINSVAYNIDLQENKQADKLTITQARNIS